MKSKTLSSVYVVDGSSDSRIGMLHFQNTGRGGIFSFEYEDSWLASENRYQIDPKLDLVPGHFKNANANNTFGIFSDASPDRWGRVLMERREIAAHDKEINPGQRRSMNDWDFLLGVDDEYRMGALRFQDPETGEYLAAREPNIPHKTSLPALQEAAKHIENGDISGDEYLKWMALLIAPGTSLGGARPKASFQDKHGMWIAKFPSKDDRYDVGLFEKLMYDMARLCNIEVPESKIAKIEGAEYNTFMSLRFDRGSAGQRIPYMSAMTACEKLDSEGGGSYLDIADQLEQYAVEGEIKSNLNQLWRRIVFNILTGNTDDHLRNHGFIYGSQGWCLSPAFDMNPNYEKYNHALSINVDDDRPIIENAMEMIELFRYSQEEASNVMNHIHQVVSNWKSMAQDLGATRYDIALLEPAFMLEDSG